MLLGCRKDYDNRDIDLCGSHPVLFDFNGYAFQSIQVVISTLHWPHCAVDLDLPEADPLT